MVALIALLLLQAGEPIAEARRLATEGHLERAITVLYDARRGESPSLPLLALLAQFQTANDELPQAADTLREALELRPGAARLRATLGTLYFQLRRYERARAELEQALRSEPGNPIAHYYLAAVLKNEGELQAALPHAETAVELMPDAPPQLDTMDHSLRVNALFLLAEIRSALGDEDAEILLKQVTELDSTHPGPHYLLGRLLLKDGRGDEAGHQLELFRQTKQASAHVELAANASRAGHRDMAVAELRRALDSYPEHPRALFLLAMELARRGEREEAAACLRRILVLRPETRETVEPLLDRLENR